MYHHLSYQQFVELLHKLCWDRRSGFVFFSTLDGSWGKFKIHEGQIISFGYNSIWGEKALPAIKKIDQVKCFFQAKSEPAEVEDTPVRQPSADGATLNTVEILARLLDLEMLDAVKRAENDIEQGWATVKREEQDQKPVIRRGEKSILVVDDSQMARQALIRPLEASGYHVTEAQDGYEAIGLAEDIRPDLMILDAQMPGVDGFKVLQILRGSSQLKQLPVFLVAPKEGVFRRLMGKMADCDEFLIKPVDPSDLLKLVRKHLLT